MVGDEGQEAQDSSFIRHRNAYLDDDLGKTESIYNEPNQITTNKIGAPKNFVTTNSPSVPSVVTRPPSKKLIHPGAIADSCY